MMFAHGSELRITNPAEQLPWSVPPANRRTDQGSRGETHGSMPVHSRPSRALQPIVWESPAVRIALAQAEQVAPMPSPALLRGETGGGKEGCAQKSQELSGRRRRPMSRGSCAAIPSTLIESELFGHERGAFTGA